MARALLAAGEAGIDSETHGQPDRTSPQHRAQVHHWSIAVLGATESPRGYRLASGAVLPVAALGYDPLVAALKAVKLWAHNAPHDYHAFRNGGVELEIDDTLQWLRVAVPGMKEYGLKAVERWALGKPARPDFLEVVTHPVAVYRTTTRHETRCACGKVPCRARSTSDFYDQILGVWRPHRRDEVAIETTHESIVDQRWDVTEFGPGHPRWDTWLHYALTDAVSGIELVSWLRNKRYKETRYPWQATTDNGT